jgi:hypothetical protein
LAVAAVAGGNVNRQEDQEAIDGAEGENLDAQQREALIDCSIVASAFHNLRFRDADQLPNPAEKTFAQVRIIMTPVAASE